MHAEVSIDQLASYCDERPEDIRRWQDEGLLSNPLTLRDAERLRLIRALERRGLSAEIIALAFGRHNDVIDSLLDQFGIPDEAEFASALDALANLDVESELLDRIVTAGNFEDSLRQPTADDIAALDRVRSALEGGFPEDALFQLIRVYRDALGRVADAEVRLFHIHVHQAFHALGLRGTELTDATTAAAHGMEELIEPTLLYFHRLAWKDALRDDLVRHVLEELGVGEPAGSEGRLWRAVVFVDLSSFTPLTDVMGDAVAATILDRFSVHMRRATRAESGTVVKQIGDAFMAVFLNVSSAVSAILELQRQLAGEPQFPAIHAGIHFGPVLYREGDYIGGTVNVAARLSTEAAANEIVVSGAARREAGALPAASFHPLGKRTVKGVAEPVELFVVHPTDRMTVQRQTDPICGMQLANDEIAARTTIGDDEHVFCSTTCMALFVAQHAALPTTE